MHREESLSAWVGHGSPVEGTQEAICQVVPPLAASTTPAIDIFASDEHVALEAAGSA
jgi:hypothetical protein